MAPSLRRMRSSRGRPNAGLIGIVSPPVSRYRTDISRISTIVCVTNCRTSTTILGSITHAVNSPTGTRIFSEASWFRKDNGLRLFSLPVIRTVVDKISDLDRQSWQGVSYKRGTPPVSGWRELNVVVQRCSPGASGSALRVPRPVSRRAMEVTPANSSAYFQNNRRRKSTAPLAALWPSDSRARWRRTLRVLDRCSRPHGGETLNQ